MAGDGDLTAETGSPPRVRGKVPPITKRLLLFRITPACAGKSCSGPGCGEPARDHPRVCGEKDAAAYLSKAKRGSPPRVRGKVDERCHKNIEVGITPACAGKRPLAAAVLPGCQDHPRVCGEKPSMRGNHDYIFGSPPRVRGKAGNAAFEGGNLGITPACAGKSETSASRNGPFRDHPRVCGEKTKKIP